MSEIKRFFVPSVPAETFEIDGTEYNHIVNVMRLGVGTELVLCCGDGKDYTAVIESIRKKSLTVRVLSCADNLAEPDIEVTLYQAVCKGERMELIVQKTNELGVSRIVPFVSKFTTVKADTGRIDRWRKIATESAKQCGRARVPEISDVTSFEKVLNEFAEYDIIIFAYEACEDGSLIRALEGSVRKIALVVGSEGGFDAEEVRHARERGARIVTMGRRILRAETAAIALVSATMCLAGEW